MVYRELSVGKSVGQSESVTIMIKNNPSIKPLPMLADGSAARRYRAARPVSPSHDCRSR
jgi:hypothetical protein